MYADPAARGGVLEPEGIVEIKFRAPDLIKAMHRLDPVIARIKAEVGPDTDAAICAREAALLPVYRQVCSMLYSILYSEAWLLQNGIMSYAIVRLLPMVLMLGHPLVLASDTF